MARKYRASATFETIMIEAVEKKGVLFPFEAMAMIEKHYGLRAGDIKSGTLKDMIEDICQKNGHTPCDEQIVDAVSNFMLS